jgi:hypothetical protein
MNCFLLFSNVTNLLTFSKLQRNLSTPNLKV